MSLIEAYDQCLREATTGLLGTAVPLLLRIAKETRQAGVEAWARLEMEGYWDSNPALTDATDVPKYRWVGGQWSDPAQRTIAVPSDLAFLNSLPLRHPVAELETMSRKSGLLKLRDAAAAEYLTKTFGVAASDFSFTASSIVGILGGIRARMLDHLGTLRGAIDRLRETPPGSAAAATAASLDVHLLHPRVVELAARSYTEGRYRHALLDTFVGLVEDVRAKSGERKLDGSPLMQQVFSARNPILRVSEDGDEQVGFMWLFSGAVMGVRNPRAHRIADVADAQTALEWLAFASVLFKALDGATAPGRDAGAASPGPQ